VFCRDAGTRRAAELERLQAEVNAQEDFIEVVVAATFGFPDVPEDKDNMSIEILAEVHCALRRRVCRTRALCWSTRALCRATGPAAHTQLACSLRAQPCVCAQRSPVRIQMLRMEGFDNTAMIQACKVGPPRSRLPLSTPRFLFALCIVRF
jgi:hypothetical protein